jgi:hypothetical protein
MSDASLKDGEKKELFLFYQIKGYSFLGVNRREG